MKYTNWRPFMMFGLMFCVIFFIGLSFLAMLLFRSSDGVPVIPHDGWGPGSFGIIFPCFGLVMMLLMMSFFFFNMMTGGEPMWRMMRRGGPMSWMMGDTEDPRSQSPVSRDETQDTCSSCESSIQDDWKACPYCGQKLSYAGR